MVGNERSSVEAAGVTGSVAVVIGGGSGIGAGIADELARRGARVVVADVAADRATEVEQRIKAAGGVAESAVVDVRAADSVEQLAADAFARHGAVRVMVNAAGIEATGYLWDTPPDLWRQLMAVNLDGVFHGIRSFAPRMGASAEPSFLSNIASIGAVTTARMQAPYIASKHAVQAMVECLHIELATAFPQISASVVNPAPVATRIFTDAEATGTGAEERRAQMADMIANGMDPGEAGRRIVEQILAGDFWISSEPDRFAEAARRRADRLAALSRPEPAPAGG